MPVPIGKMTDLVEIGQPSVNQDPAGGEKVDYRYDQEAMVWLKALRGREFVEARQVVSQVTHRITGHFDELAHVTAESRIRSMDDGREFDVIAAVPSDQNDIVEIMAVHRANP